MVKVLPTKHILMRGNYKSPKRSGFSLIEVVVVVLIIGIMAATVIPNLFTRKKNLRGQCFDLFSTVLDAAYVNALMTQKLQRIVIDLDAHTVFIEESKDEKQFTPVRAGFFSKARDIPQGVELRRLFINGKDELSGLGATKKVWFFVTKQGIAQPVVLDFSETDNDRQFSFEVNPFFASLSAREENSRV